MLEKPDFPDEKITACLSHSYGLAGVNLTFLPLGTDFNTVVYRADTASGLAYFVKLRRGSFDEMSVLLPIYLSQQGIPQIVAPLTAHGGRPWVELDPYRLILYPFIPGQDAYATDIPAPLWVQFGSALKRIHAAPLPLELRQRITQETYSPSARHIVKHFLKQMGHRTYEEPVARQVAALLIREQEQVRELIHRAERLAAELQALPRPFILCHSDIHAGNLHLGHNNQLYIVDWDEPILAPKERDLMYIGGGLMGRWIAPDEELRLFYQGYGHVEIDPVALAYYRYQRIIQDIAAYCQKLLSSAEGGSDRQQSYQHLASDFEPGGLIALTCRFDRTRELTWDANPHRPFVD